MSLVYISVSIKGISMSYTHLSYPVLPHSLLHSLTTSPRVAVLAQFPSPQRSWGFSSVVGAIVPLPHGHHTACKQVKW